MEKYDVIVIGSGPGGYVAAIRAAHLGLKTAIVEKDSKLGGTCLLRGCIPTKSMLHSADVYQETQAAMKHGILTGDVGFDFSKVQKERAKIVQKSAAGVQYLMKTNKITVHAGHGRLTGPNNVSVTGKDGSTELQSKFIILATGSVPRALPHIPIDKKHIMTSDEVLELEQPPKSLAVLGAGAVGVEFASVYSRFGTEVTIIEMADRILPIEDADVSKELEKIYKKRGMNIETGTKLEKAEVKDGMVEIMLATKSDSKTIKAEKLLLAVGRAPVTEDVGLDKVGIATDRGFIPVDGMMRTSVPSIYAIGDIVPTPQLAHTASHEAILAVDHLAGKHVEEINYLLNPSCTYCEPEVASVGLTEAKAKEQGYEVKVGKFPFSALGKARVMNQTEGFVKVVSDKQYDEILGVHIIGARATDLIAEACVALRMEITTEELAHTIHAHPTLPEAVHEAAHAAIDRPLHM